MSDNPYHSPENPNQPTAPSPPVQKRGFRLVELLVVFGVIAVIVGLLLPSVRSARPAARRSQCANNLTIIALALQSYEMRYRTLPPAYTVDAQGKPLHSWRTLILPFLEQQALYAKIDLSKPWDDPSNRAAREASIEAYQCPEGQLQPNHTTYLAVAADGGCFLATEPRKLSEIADGAGHTLMVIEVEAKNSVPWMAPTDADELAILSLAAGPNFPHAGGFQGAFVDGQTRYLSSKIEPAVLRALISVAGQDNDVLEESRKDWN